MDVVIDNFVYNLVPISFFFFGELELFLNIFLGFSKTTALREGYQSRNNELIWLIIRSLPKIVI